ncbi:MAG TPA: DUF4440 domain-containing protein [Actinophytocola sp.]|uniref:nuclear transport factor 2 family protein n=1 Tax=Actinophytocola sp. TaxID=1872138 RepID=UPI002DDC9F56|nr:DUF4440 domain-containing protein [Actinophytocola sp.]HEV2783000.1 DUF4440 domain-containing protein [Actinophytocola sp.]
MEPVLVTEPRLAEVLTELVQREPLFHRPELGTTRAHFEAMTAADFWEVDASGRCYSREYVLDALDERFREHYRDPWWTTGFHCRELAPELYLLTYTLTHGHRTTRRTSIWRHTVEGWKVLFHQGTLVTDER